MWLSLGTSASLSSALTGEDSYIAWTSVHRADKGFWLALLWIYIFEATAPSSCMNIYWALVYSALFTVENIIVGPWALNWVHLLPSLFLWQQSNLGTSDKKSHWWKVPLDGTFRATLGVKLLLYLHSSLCLGKCKREVARDFFFWNLSGLCVSVKNRSLFASWFCHLGSPSTLHLFCWTPDQTLLNHVMVQGIGWEGRGGAAAWITSYEDSHFSMRMTSRFPTLSPRVMLLTSKGAVSKYHCHVNLTLRF